MAFAPGGFNENLKPRAGPGVTLYTLYEGIPVRVGREVGQDRPYSRRRGLNIDFGLNDLHMPP